ncbi:MAG: translation initiation factor IF-3 [Patulibacter sp.]
MPDRDTTRINERIRVPEVRLIDEHGEQVGILPTDQALRMAQDRDLDLVEVAAASKPPVCRILDYSKYKYEQAQKQKAARKHQTQIVLREIKFRPKIAQHDYDTKKGHVERFLLHKDKVKITIMFRGREVTHPERGQAILERLADELELIAQVDQRPQQDGRNMTMLLSPSKAVLAGQIDAEAWKNRDLESGELAEGEGITVDGPGEEPSPTPEPAPAAEARPRRSSRSKSDAAPPEPETQAVVVADDAATPEPTPEPVVEATSVPVIEPEAQAEPEPEAVAEPEPEPEPAPKPKPKKAGPAPVSKAEAARKRKPQPKLNLGTGAASPLAKKDEDEEASADGAAAPKKPRKAPTKAAAAAAVAGAKKASAKAPAKKQATTEDADPDS